MTATVVTSYVGYIYVANFITQLASYLMYIYYVVLNWILLAEVLYP